MATWPRLPVTMRTTFDALPGLRPRVSCEWSTRRHEIDQCDNAVARRKFCFENERIGAVAPCDPRPRVHWRYPPSSMLGIAEQRGKAGAAIEPGPAKPVDRTVAGHQRRCFAIADESIVLYWVRHYRGLSTVVSLGHTEII